MVSKLHLCDHSIVWKQRLMSEEVTLKLNRIATKLGKVSKHYSQLKQDNEALQSQNRQLKGQLSEESSKRQALEDNYNRLKLAKALVTNTGDKAEMKFRVNELVKEIDKCIALLNR